MKHVVLMLIRAYQCAISPILGSQCRFVPTCSNYAREAILVHGVRKGGVMSVARIMRCHPFHNGGYDPVPKNPSLPDGSEERLA